MLLHNIFFNGIISLSVLVARLDFKLVRSRRAALELTILMHFVRHMCSVVILYDFICILS